MGKSSRSISDRHKLQRDRLSKLLLLPQGGEIREDVHSRLMLCHGPGHFHPSLIDVGQQMNDFPTVSVVDDDRDVQESIAAILSARGFGVSAFGSSGSFLQTVRHDSVGGVIAELRMPGMDGRQLLQEVSSLAKALAVIVISEHVDVPTTVDLMSRGAVTVLEKPFSETDLMSAVTTATSRSREVHSKSGREQDIQRRLLTLSDQEREIAKGMIAGEPIKALARSLRISMRTVDRRRQSILTKMQANSIGELASLCSESFWGPNSLDQIRFDPPASVVVPERHQLPDWIPRDGIPREETMHSSTITATR